MKKKAITIAILSIIINIDMIHASAPAAAAAGAGAGAKTQVAKKDFTNGGDFIGELPPLRTFYDAKSEAESKEITAQQTITFLEMNDACTLLSISGLQYMIEYVQKSLLCQTFSLLRMACIENTMLTLPRPFVEQTINVRKNKEILKKKIIDHYGDFFKFYQTACSFLEKTSTPAATNILETIMRTKKIEFDQRLIEFLKANKTEREGLNAHNKAQIIKESTAKPAGGPSLSTHEVDTQEA